MNFLTLHILLALAAAGLSLLLAFIAILYLWQRTLLKQKWILQSPLTFPLNRLENILIFSLWCGFICLSFSFISGIFYRPQWIAQGEFFAVKTIWAFTVWMWYGVALFLRHVYSFTAKALAYMCLVGFVLLASTFFGFIFFPLRGL